MFVIAACMSLWVLGMITSWQLGGGIHAFLVIAIAWFLLRMVHGRVSK
jgi:hypothetical protein